MMKSEIQKVMAILFIFVYGYATPYGTEIEGYNPIDTIAVSADTLIIVAEDKYNYIYREETNGTLSNFFINVYKGGRGISLVTPPEDGYNIDYHHMMTLFSKVINSMEAEKVKRIEGIFFDCCTTGINGIETMKKYFEKYGSRRGVSEEKAATVIMDSRIVHDFDRILKPYGLYVESVPWIEKICFCDADYFKLVNAPIPGVKLQDRKSVV